MSIIAWLVVGAVAGWIAGELMRGRGFGLVGNIIVGIIGAVVGGFLAQALGLGGQPSGINIYSIIVAVIGAVVLLFIIGMVSGRRTV
ncbi:MAG TPA: GlsB/YeaQ/YmgE family stress response membrane protein [Ardenticatenaceae bacterium]|nr:GlsB/YeaQ/YmgE family stress response membrane protein [Ardenticatenaceae bacterium]